MASAAPIIVSGDIIPKQIDYAVRHGTTAPLYKMMKIPLNNFSSFPITIDSTGSRVFEWKLPTQVYNLAKSYISYSINMAAPGAGSNCHYENCFELGNQITFGAASGNSLCDLSFLQNYTRLARPIDTPFDDYVGNSNLSGMYRCNTLNTANSMAAPYRFDGAITVPPFQATNYASTESFIEPRYFITPAASTVTSNVWRQYPLAGFTNTIFSVDKDIYFGPQEQYIRVTAGTGNKMGFVTTNPAIPGTNATVAGVTTVNDCFLYLAIEQNPIVRDAVLGLFHTDRLKMRIPFTTGFKNVGSTRGTQTNIGISFSQQYGKRLRRILHSVWNPNETSNTAYDCANFNGVKIQSFNTYLDSQVLQDRAIDCRQPFGSAIFQDDWAENKKYVDRRVVTSKEMYQLNWFHIDQFFSPPDDDNSLPPSNLDEGLAMTSAKQWLFSGLASDNVNTPSNLVHYTFATFDREIMITANGPIWI